jgi:argininosuccinate lyase
MIKTVKINAERISQAMKEDYILATDLADYLVKKGLPFREAHGVIAKLGEYAIGKGKNFRELSLKEYNKFSPLFTDDVYNITGTSPQQVGIALTRAKRLIKE